jgi:putative tricarboxylic transport membrane protein
MLLGLLVSCIGMENPAGTPRFTFGVPDLLGGIEAVPALVGVFALAEVMRALTRPPAPPVAQRRFGSILKGQWELTKKYQWPMWRGNVIGIIIGVLPGAGADMAAWVSYAMSKRFSKEPEKFGTGHPEGLVEAGASNNASLASGWVPSLLFGIPGDTITAIAIGVLYMKGLNPGPTLFTERASSMYALYIVFILANIILIPLGIVMIRIATKVLRAPLAGIMPVILLLCAVGAFATGNNLFAVVLVAVFGCLGFVMERNGYPVAAMVLGIVMGTMVEQNFVTSLIKSDGDVLPFFDRPVSAVLAAMTFGALLWPLGVWAWKRLHGSGLPAAKAAG